MNPTGTFDPLKPAMVHDRLNDRTFEWTPETMQANYEQYAEPFASEIIGSDGCSSSAGPDIHGQRSFKREISLMLCNWSRHGCGTTLSYSCCNIRPTKEAAACPSAKLKP